MARKRPSKPAPTDVPAAEVKPPESTVEKVEAGGQVRFMCPKHGDITNAVLHMTFANPEGQNQGQFLYCMHCLNEVLLSLQKAGTIETVQIHVPEELAEKIDATTKAANAAKEEKSNAEKGADMVQDMMKPEEPATK